MTTLKPQLIRADTLDLQDHETPSAKDHTRQPTHPAPYGIGPAAPHQSQALRNAEYEAQKERKSSPVVSPRHSDERQRGNYPDEPDFYDDHEDSDHHEQSAPHEHLIGELDHDSGVEDGDVGDQGEDDSEDDLMDKISSSPSIDDEDIDFEFVYALHTFVATVEGQANATKGDTMVLLDDSNSYWWLVRVVKDGSIGYLPAEHIETPTERLARLNKHRNIDLSATMLGDNPEKSKNPLKKAMRRRNAKTVQFAAPQYFEPSDFDYSDEEDEGPEGPAEQVDNGIQGSGQDAQHGNGTEVAAVAPLKINTQQAAPITNGIHRTRSDESMNSDKAPSPEKQVSSETNTTNEVQDDTNIRPRNRAVRNTDSFYKDDTVETKKISLTPRLLRGDLDGSEQSETRQKTSLETFDKIVATDNEKPKEDKKKKEKKGMLSGLFKRKDKKPRPGENDVDDAEKTSEELTRASPQSRESQESVASRLATSPLRQTSKLHKQPPPKAAAKSSPVQDGFQGKEPLSTAPAEHKSSTPEVQVEQPNTARLVVPEQQNGQVGQADQSATQKNAQARSTSPTTSPGEKKSVSSPIITALRSSPSNASLEGEPVVKAAYAKKAKYRFEIDAADSEDDGMLTAATKPHRSNSSLESGHLSDEPPEPDSPAKVPPHIEEPKQAPPPPPPPPPSQSRPLLSDTSASEPQSISAPSPSGSSSTSLVDVDTANDVDQSTNGTTNSPRVDAYTPSTTRSTPTWSDASLRNYMDNDQGIRDLLIIVHDKSNVVPAGSDHPIMGNLFVAEKSKLAEMQTTLDSMLTGWLSRKNATLLPR